MVPNYPLSQKVLLLHQGALGSVVVVCRREAVEGQGRGLRQELNHALEQQARQHDLDVILLHELVYSNKNVSKSLILFGLQKMCVTLLFESLNLYPLMNSKKFEVSEGIGVSGLFETGSKDHLQWPLVLAKKQLS